MPEYITKYIVARKVNWSTTTRQVFIPFLHRIAFFSFFARKPRRPQLYPYPEIQASTNRPAKLLVLGEEISRIEAH
jgi:hypothetical protein